MENMMIRYVFDRKRKASNTIPALLQIEIRPAGSNKTVLESTGIHLFKNQFSPKNGFTCVNHDRAIKITLKAREVYNKIEAFVASSKCATLSDVKNWQVVESSSYSVISFIREELAKQGATYTTLEYHNSLIKRVEEFGKIKTFDDFTYTNLCDLDAHLRKTIQSKPTLYKRHNTLRRYIRLAVRKGFCSYNPYDDFTFEKGKSPEPEFLLEHEVKALEKYVPNTKSLQAVKDLFLFQCYTGMAYTDLMSFDASKIYKVDGYEVYRSSRNKTDESFICLMLPEATAIIKKYNGVLPRLSNVKYNLYIKVVIAGAGINKVVTTHTGRHTFATYLLNKGVPIETVSRAIGHSTIRQTQHYARMLGGKVVSDLSAILLNKVNK